MTAPTGSLHPRLAEVVNLLAQERSDVLGYVSALPEAVTTKRPAPDRWSVAETMEHLSMIEDGVGRLISNLVKQAKADGAVAEVDTTSVLSSLDQYDLENGEKMKLVAPAMVQPAGAQSVSASIERLTNSRARLLDAIEKANGLDLGRVAAPHPFLGPISGYQWLVLIAKHELRHLRQMKAAVHHVNAQA